MSEPIDWLPDGTPTAPRFGDRYHSENGGCDQARRVFLQGCGLPAVWAGQPQWRVLETGFGFGLNFLVTWAAWRADPHRPRLLHFISTEAWPVSAPTCCVPPAPTPELAPLAEQLHAQWWGLLPGVHRLAFEDGACCSRCMWAMRKKCCASRRPPPTWCTSTVSALRQPRHLERPHPQSRGAAAAGARSWPPGPLPAPCAMRWPNAVLKCSACPACPQARQPARHLQPRWEPLCPHGHAAR